MFDAIVSFWHLHAPVLSVLLPAFTAVGMLLLGDSSGLAAQGGHTVALVGSTDESLRRAASALRAAVPGLQVACTIAPPFGFDPEGPGADAILRYNSCVRMLEAHPELRPEPVDEYEAHMLE